MKPAISIILLTDGICQLKCPTCPAGRREYNPGRMDLELGKRILAKAVREAAIIQGCVYYYNEPFLHPDVAKFIELYHSYNIPTFLSTNLNTFQRVPEVMTLKPRSLLISLSGWTQEVYERGHAGGNIEKVKQNMERLSKIRDPKTWVQVSWHIYPWNKHEEPLMRAYTEKLGFHFHPYGVGILPVDRVERAWDTGIPDPLDEEGFNLVPLAEAKELCLARKHWPCTMQNQVMVIDAKGEVLLCSNRNEAYYSRGSFFDRSVAEILAARKTDPVCIACKARGSHVYCAQEYTRSEWSPIRHAENLYRRLGLQRWPKFSAKMAEWFYIRPK